MDDLRCRIAVELPRLRRYALALTKSQDCADDLIQETLLRALDKLHLWREGTDLRAWLFTLMHNQHVNSVRAAVRKGQQLPVDTAYDLGHPPAQADSLLLRDFQRAFDQLPDEQRVIVLMAGLEGMDYQQIATVLSIPTGTVRSRLSRARETLRTLMDTPEFRKTQPRPRQDVGRGATKQPVGSTAVEADHCLGE